MAELPVVSGKDVVKILEKAGFSMVRQVGSHCQMRHADGRRATIPIHGNRDMPRGTLKAILRDIEIDTETFLKLL